jgi:hypothetical protein
MVEPMDLRARIQQLATHFAASVLGVIREASLDELLGPRAEGGLSAAAPRTHVGKRKQKEVPRPLAKAPRARPAGRLPRRSAADIAKTVGTIVALLRKHKAGLRAEQIRDALGLVAKEMPRPLSEGVKSRAFKKKGQKRATTYFL